MALAVLLAPPINAHPPPRAGARDAGVDEMAEFRALFRSGETVAELADARLVCRGKLRDHRPRNRHLHFQLYRFRVPDSPQQRVAEFVCTKLSTGGALMVAGDTYYAYANSYELAQLVNSLDTLAGRPPVSLRLCVGSRVGKASPKPGDVREFAGSFVFPHTQTADEAFERLCRTVARIDGFVEYLGYSLGGAQLDVYPDTGADRGVVCETLKEWRDGGISWGSCDWIPWTRSEDTASQWKTPLDEPDGGEDD